jgi:hypothetical protein
MKRNLVAFGVAVSCVGAALAATGAAAAAPVRPRARLTHFLCQRAIDPGQRLVSVEAVMRPLTGTKGLELKFDLLSKAPGAINFGVVRGGDLGSWITPAKQAITLGTRPGDVWSLNHPVADLPAPASYRFQVLFRWIGAHGRVLATVQRDSKSCFQAELRPDLEAQSLVAQAIPSKPKRDLYVGMVTDSGLTGAGPFAVEFADGGIVKDRTIPHIDAHQTLTVRFEGPLCVSSAPPTMTIDPTQQVDAYTRASNSISATCPPSGSAPPPA